MDREVILFPTYEQALEFRKHAAFRGARNAFGLRAATPASWLSDAWGLYGDGRHLVDPLQRKLALRSLLSSGEAGLVFTEGLIDVAAEVFSSALGSEGLTCALQGALPELTREEQALLALVGRYRDLLSGLGLIEPADALEILGSHPARWKFRFGVPMALSPAFSRFIGMQGFSGEPVISPLSLSVEPRFLIAAGPSARNALIADALRDSTDCYGPGYSCLVVCADPKVLYDALSPVLAPKGFTLALDARVAFATTSFGQAFLSLLDAFAAEGDPASAGPVDARRKRALSEYFASPFSGVGDLRSSDLDAALRADRLLGKDDLVALARLVSPHFDAFEELLRDCDASLLLDYLIDVASRTGTDPSWRIEQIGAMKALRSVYETARAWPVQPVDLRFAYDSLVVDVSRMTGDGPFKVTIASIGQAQKLTLGRFDEVMVCDLDAETYPASEDHSAAGVLLGRLGITPPSRLSQTRLLFEQLKSCAQKRFTCQRTLRTGEGEDLYPSFVLDEFISLFSEPDEKLDDYGLPRTLRSRARVCGEEAFHENIACDKPQQAPLVLPEQASGALEDEAKGLLFTRFSFADGQLILSPSAIEAYVNCPYSWFVQRRLRPEPPDEGFGPLEVGVLSHAAFQRFYDAWNEKGRPGRVRPDTLEEAKELFRREFEALCSEQPQSEGTRLVAVDAVERNEIGRILDQLLGSLELQARLMPDFTVLTHELETKAQAGVSYAGVRLRGRVDRVDVNETMGQYVVIDYKGQTAGHEAGFSPEEEGGSPDVSFSLPHKIQALIYAQALRSLFPGRHPVGALYLNYRASRDAQLCAGSYAETLGISPFAPRSCKVEGSFEAFLDRVEAAVAARLEGLREGAIPREPLCVDSCRHCPVVGCPRRLA